MAVVITYNTGCAVWVFIFIIMVLNNIQTVLEYPFMYPRLNKLTIKTIEDGADHVHPNEPSSLRPSGSCSLLGTLIRTDLMLKM